MRDNLIDMIIYKGIHFENPNVILENGIDEEIIDAIALMLAACEKCYQHIQGYYVDSEYINKAVFSAILRRLERTFYNLDIPLPDENILIERFNMNISRFGIQYNKLKIVFNSLNPPRERKNKELENYQNGIMTSVMFSQFFKKM